MLPRAGDVPSRGASCPFGWPLCLSLLWASLAFPVGPVGIVWDASSAFPDGQKSREEYRAVTPHARRSSASFPPASTYPTRSCEVEFRDSPGSILPETSSAPAGAKYTVGTEKMIENAAATFTTESGMVKMPCDHSFIHIHHFIRAGCSTTYTFR